MKLRLLTIALLGIGCAAEGDLAPESIPAPGNGGDDGFCPSVPVGIIAAGVPERICVPADPLAEALITEVNQFWTSRVEVCQCGPDSAGDCEHDAFSLGGTGYLYYDLAMVSQVTRGGLTPGHWVFAHELGHEIQGRLGASQSELGADCLAGYFFGSHVCQGRVTEAELMQTLADACEAGGGAGWFDAGDHGSCAARVEAVVRGVRAYLAGAPALESCES